MALTRIVSVLPATTAWAVRTVTAAALWLGEGAALAGDVLASRRR